MLILMLGGLGVLWYFSGKLPRSRRKLPGYAVMLIGFLLLLKAPAVGLGLIVSGAIWLHGQKRSATARRPFSDTLALADARDLLGLPPGADREAIITAHRRLIARYHPDSGGTEGLAARLNAARDLLLQQVGR